MGYIVAAAVLIVLAALAAVDAALSRLPANPLVSKAMDDGETGRRFLTALFACGLAFFAGKML